MKLSIVTICYNDKAGFERTAKSVISQDSKDFEWIIIDGGSTDGGAEFNKNTVDTLYADPLTSVLVGYFVSERDNGIYNAMNKGIKHTKGEYVQFLNSGDCLLEDNTISKVISYLIEKDLYVADICHPDDNSQKPGFNLTQDITDKQLVYQLMLFTLPHPSSFFKRDFFDRFGYFDETLKVVSDWKLYFQSIVMNNATIQILPFVTTLFDTTGISNTGNKSDEERKVALYEYPRMNTIIRYYRETYEIVSALQSKWYGRFLVRLCYFIIRKFNNTNIT